MESVSIADSIIRFVNPAFGRRLSVSRSLCDAIRSALDDGYSPDEIRSVFWVARSLPGEVWIKNALSIDWHNPIPPEMALRHHGGVNPVTGVPAKRWLDELLSRRLETNPQLIGVVLESLPTAIIDTEKPLLERMNIPFEMRRGNDVATH